VASISTGHGGGGRRALDHEIPLVPFIDLLLCCIMFLLVTAVWNQLSSIEASTPSPSATGTLDRPAPDVQPLTIRVSQEGYHLVGDAGDELRVPRTEDALDVAGLREHLAVRRRVAPNERDVVVSAEDGVAYAELVLTMDAAIGSGFDRVSLSGTP
jgi:biopolymer transport protein ExbD